MAVSHCPGQNRRYWKPEDIVSVACPACGLEIELFKDEGRRRCPGCGIWVTNPRVAESCASWCSFAEDCLGVRFHDAGRKSETSGTHDPSEKLITSLSKTFGLRKDESVMLFKVTQAVNGHFSPGDWDPAVVKVLSVLVAFSRLRTDAPDSGTAGSPHPSFKELLHKLPDILAACGMSRETVEEIIEIFTGTNEAGDRKGIEPGGAIDTVIDEVIEKACPEE